AQLELYRRNWEFYRLKMPPFLHPSPSRFGESHGPDEIPGVHHAEPTAWAKKTPIGFMPSNTAKIKLTTKRSTENIAVKITSSKSAA
ncbi:MAG: hypothetical protein Q4C61_17760, partial [Lachnospiraceae bacterium]|nr:hypothetical protein [Lachnospiraceae bacterium]